MDRSLLQKYLAPDEDWRQLCDRVSGIMQYAPERERLFRAIHDLEFIPNSPCLVNAHRPGQRNMMACHLIHVPDSIHGIFEAAKSCALVFKSSGGIGLELSGLSPTNTQLKYAPGGFASGPVSFMKLFNTTAQVVMEGGLRRAALMGTLNANHPDIYNFITAKETDGTLSNFNISVTIDDGPDSIDKDVWDAITKHAWNNGEPGVIFLDNVNADNPTVKEFGRIIGANACQPGFATVFTKDGIKHLSHIGIGSVIWGGNKWVTVTAKACTGFKPVYRIMVNGGQFIGTLDHKVICNGERVLAGDATHIDVAHFPDYRFNSSEARPVLEKEYLEDYNVYEITVDSEEHTYWTGGLLVSNCSELPLYDYGSCVLGHAVLPHVIKSPGDYTRLRKVVKYATRFLNRVIDINPYPLPQIAQSTRRTRSIGIGVMGWADLLEREGIPFTSRVALELANEIAGEMHGAANTESWTLARRDGGYLPGRRRNATLLTIAPTGHTSRLAGVYTSIYPRYEVGMKMTVDQHLEHIATWQAWVDNSISYTISFPNDAPESITDTIYRGAWERGLKNISVYRDGSREGQPCNIEGECSIEL